MQTKTIDTYTYDELSAAAQATARDWFREAGAGDIFYAEAVEEDAMTIAKLMGITIREYDQKCHQEGRDGKPGRDFTRHERAIFWSGFSSQGDGACFEGTWHGRKCTGVTYSFRQMCESVAQCLKLAKDGSAFEPYVPFVRRELGPLPG